MQRPFSTTAYRNPDEIPILVMTLALVALVIAITASATMCTSFIFVLIVLGLAYSSGKSHHMALMRRAQPAGDFPELSALAQRCQQRLQPGPVEVYVTRARAMNAYTFGLEGPKVVVLYSALFEIMDADELSFILGHELGHVRLSHTRLNSLVGGLAGIPATSGSATLLALAFLSWNRACERSADRAGLLACGRMDKAISALVKLVAGPQGLTPAGLEAAYHQIDAQDDTWLGGLSEALGSHPLLIRRINALRQWAGTEQYRRLQALVNQNESLTGDLETQGL